MTSGEHHPRPPRPLGLTPSGGTRPALKRHLEAHGASGQQPPGRRRVRRAAHPHGEAALSVSPPAAPGSQHLAPPPSQRHPQAPGETSASPPHPDILPRGALPQPPWQRPAEDRWMTPEGLSGNKGSCPQGWTRWPPTSGAATPESTKRREPLENKADLGEVNPEERDTESSEAGSQVSQGSSDPEDNKIPLQPSTPWSEASNRQFSLRHHLPIRQSTPPSKACQAVCWHWENREGSDGVLALQGFLLGGRSMQPEEYAAHPGRPLGGVVHALD